MDESRQAVTAAAANGVARTNGAQVTRADGARADEAADGSGVAPAVRLAGVWVVRDGRPILDSVDWAVRPGERWVVLGPNGSGKTTLVQVAGGRLWPSKGVVELLGHRLGKVDVRTLRPRLALVSGSVIRQLRPRLTVREVVVTGLNGALEPWWHHYEPEDWEKADRLLADSGVADPAAMGDLTFDVVSEGERQHVMLARALMGSPELLLLDEPAAGLDLGARERLVSRLAALAADPQVPPVVLVTHHAEEIPPGFTHAVLVRNGRLVATGPLEQVLRSETVSECFGLPVTVGQADGRWWSRASV